MFKLTEAHPSWYRDGIEQHRLGHIAEELWRLDVNADVQVQLFAQPVHWDFNADNFDGPNDEWYKPRLFIERDTRDVTGEHRVYYACYVWKITEEEASKLLSLCLEDAVLILAAKIDYVMNLPCNKKYLF